MNNFCIDLNLSFNPFKQPIIVEDLGDKPFHKKATDLHDDFYKFLDDMNLEINLAEIFYTPKFGTIGVHEDGSGTHDDLLKINWIFGGEGSLMHWHKPLSPATWHRSKLGIPVKRYTNSKLELLHSQKVGFPSIIQVGIPHSVTAGNQNRLCLSLIPAIKGNRRKLLTFEDGVQLFNKYIVNCVI